MGPPGNGASNMAIMMLDQIQSEFLRVGQAWGSDLRPEKSDALARLDELAGSARFLGRDGETVLGGIEALRSAIAAE